MGQLTKSTFFKLIDTIDQIFPHFMVHKVPDEHFCIRKILLYRKSALEAFRYSTLYRIHKTNKFELQQSSSSSFSTLSKKKAFPFPEMDYQVVIVAGGGWRGTLPPVWVQVEGSLGSSPQINLPANTPLFKFDVSQFRLNLQTKNGRFQHKNLGLLSTLRIGHTVTADKAPKWFLDFVSVSIGKMIDPKHFFWFYGSNKIKKFQGSKFHGSNQGISKLEWVNLICVCEQRRFCAFPVL